MIIQDLIGKTITDVQTDCTDLYILVEEKLYNAYATEFEII